MLDNECLFRYFLSIEQSKKFGVKNLIFENKDYSFDKLFIYSKYYPNKGEYLNFIKSKICIKCKNRMERSYNKLSCGCCLCEKCIKINIQHNKFSPLLFKCSIYDESYHY